MLVPGAISGSWYWQRVMPFLIAAEHQAYAVNLTGLGDRLHLAHPQVDLETHIEDVVNALFYEDLSDVVLVGHSYAGFVITGVADRIPERISHLVYLDAFVPYDGECLYDLMPQIRAWALDEWRTPVDTVENLMRENPELNEADARWMVARYTPQPLKTFSQPLRLSASGGKTVPRTFIRCTGRPEGGPARPWLARPYSDPGWQVRELDTSHEAMMTRPRELSALLMDVI
jgi:pimeloyl-ACP methyl ester carboxylesterase